MNFGAGFWVLVAFQNDWGVMQKKCNVRTTLFSEFYFYWTVT